MTHPFSEIVIGDVLLAPFLADAAVSLIIILVLRPLLRRIGFFKVFSHPSIAALSLYVVILGLLTAFV